MSKNWRDLPLAEIDNEAHTVTLDGVEVPYLLAEDGPTLEPLEHPELAILRLPVLVKRSTQG